MKIKIDIELFDFIENSFFNERPELKEKINTEKNEANVIIEINEEIANIIRDWACFNLQKTGFNSNYELTLLGKYYEKIIDLLYC